VKEFYKRKKILAMFSKAFCIAQTYSYLSGLHALMTLPTSQTLTAFQRCSK